MRKLYIMLGYIESMNKLLSACSALSMVIVIALVYFIVEYSKCHHHSKLIHNQNLALGERLQHNSHEIAKYLAAQRSIEQEYLQPQQQQVVSEEAGEMVLHEHPVLHAGESSEEQNYLFTLPHDGQEHHPYVSGEEHDGIFHKHHSLKSLGL